MDESDSGKNSSETANGDECNFYPTPYLTEQFFLVSICGTLVAVISIINNSILLYLFATRPFFRRSHYFYLTVLTVFDLVHSISYILIMPTCIAFEYLENLDVMRIWYQYVVPMYTLSHVVLTASVYLLVAASVERYLTANWFSGICSKRRRFVAICFVMMFALFNKGGILLELEVIRQPQCRGLSEYFLGPTTLKIDPNYDTIWTFYYRNVACIFLPFLILLILNIAIVLQDHCTFFLSWEENSVTGARRRRLNFYLITKREDRSASTASLDQRRRSLHGTKVAYRTNEWVNRAKSRVRKAATRTLIVILLEYLLCNGFSIVVTTWEHVDKEGLVDHFKFYTFASDIISLLSVFSCAIRLPTYWICDVTFRKELGWLLLGYSKQFSKEIEIKRRQSEFPISPIESSPSDFSQLVFRAMIQKGYEEVLELEEKEKRMQEKIHLITTRQNKPSGGNKRRSVTGFRALAMAALAQEQASKKVELAEANITKKEDEEVEIVWKERKIREENSQENLIPESYCNCHSCSPDETSNRRVTFRLQRDEEESEVEETRTRTNSKMFQIL